MKNIIIIGSNSVIARDFFLHQQRINKNNFLRISRRSYDNASNSDHIFYDFSRPYDVKSYQNLLSKIRSFLDPSLDTVICLFAWSGTPRTSADLSLSDSIRRDNLNIINNLLYLVNDLDVSQCISSLLREEFITITKFPLIMSFHLQILPLHTDSKVGCGVNPCENFR